MAIEINNIIKFESYNMETGEKYELSDVSFEIDSMCPNEKLNIRSFGTCEASFTCENTMINEEVLKVFPFNEANKFDLHYTVMVQARKHKKKRINKKWLKRYGLKPRHIASKGWEIDTYNTQTGEIELTRW